MNERIKPAQERNYKSIVFTKPTHYSSQKEFRIFLIKKGENTKDHISESGIEIYNSLVCNYDYILLFLGELKIIYSPILFFYFKRHKPSFLKISILKLFNYHIIHF